MHRTYAPDADLDIFDLAPFSSDIDLEHSGGPDRTLELMYAIQEEVPFASWFRWSINDREKAKTGAAARRNSTQVPLRLMRFSTHQDAEIPDAAIRDLASREVSLARNPGFADTEIATQRRDLELHGLMMALNVEAEMRDIAGDVGPTLRAAAADWLDASGDELALASGGSRLAARFWALLAMQLARLGRDDEVTARLVDLAREHGVLNGFDINLDALATPRRAFSLSKFTVAGEFRIPEISPEIVTGEEAQVLLGATLRDLMGMSGADPQSIAGDAEHVIDPAFEVVAMVPRLTIKPYFASEDAAQADDDVFQSGMEQEFVEIAWRHVKGPPLRPHGLTAQVLPWSRLGVTTATTSALPAVGGVFDGDRPWVRARLDDLVDRNGAGRDGRASLLILQARE